MNLGRQPDRIKLEYEGTAGDAITEILPNGDNFDVFVSANHDRPTFLRLHWDEKFPADTLVLGDSWERSYADLAWRSVSEKRAMPWYFFAYSKEEFFGFGVKTGANSFVSFTCTAEGVDCLIDLRSGTHGVRLGGRRLLAAVLVFRSYEGIKPFEAMCRYCRQLCDAPLAPAQPVYGGNNWYYAYGNSSREEILSDARLQAELAKGNENLPYMVIDDGWEKNNLAGPWEPNEKYGDMKLIAEEFVKIGVKPGLWVRFLNTEKEVPTEWRFDGKQDEYLDPSVPEVIELVKEDIRKIRGWGYTLIKHDFSTYDIFGDWGKDLGETITNKTELNFHDTSRTSAEIVLDFYRAIREAAGDTIIIGCNTVSHLTAGLAELNRIGDDTSGKEWARTRDYGVNTLAFRLCQHKAFYDADADCVGILGKSIPWEKNSQWLSLLAKSGTPLFVSCPDGILSQEQKSDLKTAYKLAAAQKTKVEPIDFLENMLPKKWNSEDGILEFEW